LEVWTTGSAPFRLFNLVKRVESKDRLTTQIKIAKEFWLANCTVW